MQETQTTTDGQLEIGTWVGRQQAFAIIANKCSAAQAECLKQIRDSAHYEKFDVSWDEFCDRYVGISRREANRIIEQYDEFGAAYFRLSSLARISPEAFREIAPAVTEECIEIDGESVPLIPENAKRIQAFLRAQRAAQKPPEEPPQPQAPTLRDIEVLVREALHHAFDLVKRPVSREDYERFQSLASYAMQGWHEIGQILDKRR